MITCTIDLIFTDSDLFSVFLALIMGEKVMEDVKIYRRQSMTFHELFTLRSTTSLSIASGVSSRPYRTEPSLWCSTLTVAGWCRTASSPAVTRCTSPSRSPTSRVSRAMTRLRTELKREGLRPQEPQVRN